MKKFLLTILLLLSCVKTESQITKERNDHARKCYLATLLISQQNLPDIENYGTAEYNQYFIQSFNKLLNDLMAGYLCAEILRPKNKNTLIISGGDEK